MPDCSDVLQKELGSKGGQIVKLRINAIQRYKNQVNYNCNQRHIIMYSLICKQSFGN